MNCIASENLRQFLSNAITASERETFEPHLADCANCRRQLALMFTGDKKAEETFAAPDFLKEKVKELPETKARVIQFPAHRKTYFQWAMAAAMIICIGSIAIYVFRQTPSPTAGETFRQSNSTANTLQLLSPADGANLSREEIEFRWSPVADAKSYTLIVLDEKGDIVAQKSTAEDFLLLNVSELNLIRGKSFFWFVKANLTDGRAIDSRTARFLLPK